MAAELNKVLLIGNLTRDPEVRYLPSGAAVADLRLALNRKYKTQQGEEREEACFVNVSAWGKTAENCGQYLNKGSAILVDGRLKFDEWEKDGQKQSRLSVVAERVQFMGSPRRQDQGEYSDAPSSDRDRDHDEGRPSSPAPAPAPAPRSEPPVGDDDDLPF